MTEPRIQNINVMHVGGVHIQWLWPDQPGTDITAKVGPALTLFFDDLAAAARFFDGGAEQVAMLPDKDEGRECETADAHEIATVDQ